MKYWKSVTDLNGYTWSIDMLLMEYWLKDSIKNTIEFLHALNDEFENNNEYWEKLDVKQCSKYQNFNNFIHLRNGIVLWLGKYVLSFDKKKAPQIVNVLRLEVNPNKHFEKPIFQKLLKYILKYNGDFTLRKYDFALDINCNIDDVQVFGSKKEKGLYKGTRYFGQRSQHGFCKIYDKSKEQSLDYPLTRIEHTIEPEIHDRKTISFEPIYLKDVVGDPDLNENEKNSKNKYTIKEALKELAFTCELNNINIDDILDKLDKRTKKDIYESIKGKYKKIELNSDAHNYLLSKVFETFNNMCDTFTDAETDFVKLTSEYDLPFT